MSNRERTIKSQEFNISLPPRSTFRLEKPQPSIDSQIRTSLRAWGIQNEQIGKQNAPEKIGAEGRISRLPSAIFIEKDKTKTEEDFHRATTATHDEMYTTSQVIQPGTLLWFEKSGVSSFAVYVGNIGVQSLLALTNGNWVVDRLVTHRTDATDNAKLRIPNFLTPKELELLRQHMPKSNIARPIAGSEGSIEISMRGSMPTGVIDSFTEKMRTFQHKVNEHSRDFTGRFQQGYLRVADDHEYRIMNIRDYLVQGYGIEWDHASAEEKMAFTDCLNNQDLVTPFQTAEQLSVLVMSKALHGRLKKVIDWARHYQDTASQAALGKDVSLLLQDNPLAAFIDRARRLILISRKTRSPTKDGGLGPSLSTVSSGELRPKTVPAPIAFTETDQMIIDFIWTACFRLPLVKLDGPFKYLSVTSLILRAIGAYPDLFLSHKIGRLFLKEIGCADPWAPRANDLALPITGGKASQKTDALYEELQGFMARFDSGSGTVSLADLDSMLAIRKEWTTPTAFAIDPAESRHYEDAVSIEPAIEIEGGHWIHVHAAHVTAFFEPDSIIGRYARNQGMGIAAIDGSFTSPMIPRSITSQFVLMDGCPVITVSTLVAPDGTSLEVKMSAGTLRNVVNLTRAAVEKILETQQDSDEMVSTLLLGPEAQYKETVIAPEALALANKYRSDLVNLFDVLQQRSKKRVLELPENVSMPNYGFNVEVDVSRVEARNYRREQKSYHWTWDPSIVLTARHRVERTTEMRRKSDIVAQAMRLASESTARWLTERQIPAIFMGTEPVSDNSFATIASKDRHEQFVRPLFRRSSSPIPYWNIHVKSFCNFTSPLRRYIDMLATWQVDSYLKAEAAGTIQPGAPVPDDRMLSFTKASIDNYLHVEAHALDTFNENLQRIKDTYIFQALFRAFHFDEARLPKQWEVLILEPVKLLANLAEKPATAFLIPFGCVCEILPSTQGWERSVRHGHYLPVEIKSVDVEALVIYCQATGPPSDTQSFTDPIYISSKTPKQAQPRASRE